MEAPQSRLHLEGESKRESSESHSKRKSDEF